MVLFFILILQKIQVSKGNCPVIHSRSKVFPSSENFEFKEKYLIEKTETNFEMKFNVFNQF